MATKNNQTLDITVRTLASAMKVKLEIWHTYVTVPGCELLAGASVIIV